MELLLNDNVEYYLYTYLRKDEKSIDVTCITCMLNLIQVGTINSEKL